MADALEPVKKTRAKKAAFAAAESLTSSETFSKTSSIITEFENAIDELTLKKEEIEKLDKEIVEIRALWIKEQKNHEQELKEQREQEEIQRQREREGYDYETKLARKRAEDEFAAQKEQLAAEKKELGELRKLSEEFPTEKEKVIKEAVALAEKTLTEQFGLEKKMFDQQNKAVAEVLNLKIANLEAENSRLIKELEVVKKSLDEVTRQFREVAVKAIESNRPEFSSNLTNQK